MIPTVLVAAFVLGRWWWSVPLLAGAWGVLILAVNETVDSGLFAGAALFGAANAAVGFAAHQALVRLVLKPLRAGIARVTR